MVDRPRQLPVLIKLNEGCDSWPIPNHSLWRSTDAATPPCPTSHAERHQQRPRLRNGFERLWAGCRWRLSGRRRIGSQHLGASSWDVGCRGCLELGEWTHEVGMIVVEPGGIQTLLIEQELDNQRRTAGISLECIANFVSDGLCNERMANVVPHSRTSQQVLGPRLAQFGLVDLGGLDDRRGFYLICKQDSDRERHQSKPKLARGLGPPRRSRDSIHASPKGKRSEPCSHARRIVSLRVTISVKSYRIALRERLSGLCP